MKKEVRMMFRSKLQPKSWAAAFDAEIKAQQRRYANEEQSVLATLDYLTKTHNLSMNAAIDRQYLYEKMIVTTSDPFPDHTRSKAELRLSILAIMKAQLYFREGAVSKMEEEAASAGPSV
jgi:hypothetical protein